MAVHSSNIDLVYMVHVHVIIGITSLEKSSAEEGKGDEREKMELLVSAFSNSQQDQYEIFRRSTFPKSTIRKLMQSVCGSSVPQNAVIAMAGIAKVSYIVDKLN